jgi:hypothetical protein
MPYGIIKVDTITFTDAGVDKSIQISGLVQNPTFSGNVTCTGTISGVTVTGTVGAFTTVSGITVTGTTATFTSGNFTNISGGTYTITSGVFAAGSAASPSISFTGDSNTGLYSPGADQVAISTNGTGRLFVDASGNVGVGVSPSFNLDISGSGDAALRIRTTGTTASDDAILRLAIAGTTASNYIFFGDGDSATQGYLRYIHNDDAFLIATAGSERMRLDSSGRLGLGTSSPSAMLDVRATTGNAKIQVQETTTNRTVQLESDSSYAALYSTGARPVYLYSNGSIALTLDSSQRVGIGTTSPAVNLHINSSAASGGQLQITNASTGTASTDGLLIGYDGSNDVLINNQEATALKVNVNGSERARIDSSGRLLVGTSSAVATFNYAGADRTPRFQVVGDDINNGAAAIIRTGTAPSLFFGAGASGNNVSGSSTLSRIVFSGFHTDKYYTGAEIIALVDGTPGASDMPSALVFSTTADGASSPTERMRIAQNGVVTIQNGAVAVIGTLTDGATITPDLAADCNFTVTLGGARTIANPTNITAGQSGSIFLVQDGTGGRTASWGSYWDFPGGTAPTLSTAANAVDRVDYIVRSSTSIHTVFTANYS